MKVFLLLVVASLFNGIALADATLVFVIPSVTGKDQVVNYRIKDNMLRIDQANSKQYKLYDNTQQALINIDENTGNISRIDSDYLNSRVAVLNQQRLEKVAEVEQQLKVKLKSKSSEEKRIAQDLLAQIKYPEFYGAHTHLSVQNTKQTHTVKNIKCNVFQLTRNEQILKQLCLASQDALKLSDADYATLRGFYHFNYTVFTRLRIAMGKTDFMHVDYEKQNMVGIPIEVLRVTNKDKTPEIVLDKINQNKLDQLLFNSQNQAK
ncbi:MAG: hypothetical protein ACN4GM_16095 [Gammaproteobacteria bacterium]